MTEIAAMMGIIYSMLKKDYAMQVMSFCILTILFISHLGKYISETSLRLSNLFLLICFSRNDWTAEDYHHSLAGKDCYFSKSQIIISGVRELLPHVVFAPIYKWWNNASSLETYSLKIRSGFIECNKITYGFFFYIADFCFGKKNDCEVMASFSRHKCSFYSLFLPVFQVLYGFAFVKRPCFVWQWKYCLEFIATAR